MHQMIKTGGRDMNKKTCCLIGHRDMATSKLKHIKEKLCNEVLQAIEDGYTHFISGFAEGIDLLFATIVVKLMESNPALTLEAAIPYRNRIKTTDELFHRLLAKCNIIGVHSEEYAPVCDMKRNHFMVSQAQRVIAVYDGREKGGTVLAMRYAYSQNREVHVISYRLHRRG